MRHSTTCAPPMTRERCGTRAEERRSEVEGDAEIDRVQVLLFAVRTRQIGNGRVPFEHGAEVFERQVQVLGEMIRRAHGNADLVLDRREAHRIGPGYPVIVRRWSGRRRWVGVLEAIAVPVVSIRVERVDLVDAQALDSSDAGGGHEIELGAGHDLQVRGVAIYLSEGLRGGVPARIVGLERKVDTDARALVGGKPEVHGSELDAPSIADTRDGLVPGATSLVDLLPGPVDEQLEHGCAAELPLIGQLT